MWGLDLSGSLDGAGGVGGLLMINSAANGAHFYAFDGNGNVAALVEGTDGTASARYEYGPFGELLRGTGPMANENRFQFSTKRCDKTTDLLLYEYRAYSTSLGRWLSMDPIGERGGLHLYGFAANNPANVADSDGRGYFWTNPSSQNAPPGQVSLVAFKDTTTGDSSSGYGLGWDWLTGKSATFRFFSGHDKMAEQMRSSPEAEDARKRLREQLKNGCRTGISAPFFRNLRDEPKTEFVLGFFEDVGISPFPARNPARAFLGSFSGHATVTKCVGCCAVVSFELNNRATLESATRLPPPLGYDNPNQAALFEKPWTPIIFGAHWIADASRLRFEPQHMPKSVFPNNAFGKYGRNIDVRITWQELLCPENSFSR